MQGCWRVEVGPRAYNRAQEAYVHCVGQVYIAHLRQYDYFILYKTTGSIGGNVNKHNKNNNIKLEQHTFITITSSEQTHHNVFKCGMNAKCQITVSDEQI